MFKERSEATWYGVYLFITFFVARLLFEAWEVAGRDEFARSAWALAVAAAIGLPLGYLMRKQLEVIKLIPIAIIILIGIGLYIWL